MPTIDPNERALAAWTHLSGLAGYLVPLGGVIVPIILWVVKRDSPVVSSIAKQALLLNVIVFLAFGFLLGLCLTIIFIPVSILGWVALALVALILPIVGAVRALDGTYFRYPVVGVSPR